MPNSNPKTRICIVRCTIANAFFITCSLVVVTLGTNCSLHLVHRVWRSISPLKIEVRLKNIGIRCNAF